MSSDNLTSGVAVGKSGKIPHWCDKPWGIVSMGSPDRCYMPVRELRSTSFSVIPVTSPSFPSCFRSSRHASVLPVMLPFFPSLLRHRHLFVLLTVRYHLSSSLRLPSFVYSSLRIYSAPFMFRASFLGFVATLSYFNIFTFLWLDNKFIVFVIL